MDVPMTNSAFPIHSVLGEGKVNGIHDYPGYHHSNAEADSIAKANSEQRRVQNRMNQRARRLRIKEQDQGSTQPSRPFQVRRWRLDESFGPPGPGAFLGVETVANHRQLPDADWSAPGSNTASVTRAASSNGVPFFFPLSTDHLLHLVQYNVFRAFISNKRTLNTLLTGWADPPPSPNTCPVSGPYRDDTTVFPLNPNIPASLAPTLLQQSKIHSIWINLFPFPRVRDNLIRREGTFDHWQLLQDLVGEIMAFTPAQERRSTHQVFTASDARPWWSLPLAAGRDEDEITAERTGLIVWGEPHDMYSWELTPGFVAKWSWVLEGCDDLIESSNRWRRMRGEEPMRILASTRVT